MKEASAQAASDCSGETRARRITNTPPKVLYASVAQARHLKMSTRRGSYRSRIGLTAVIRAIAVLVVSILIAATAIPAVHVRATPTQSHGSESRSQEYESRPRDYILRGSMSGELSPRALEEVSGLRGLRGGGRSTSDGSRRTHNLASSSAAPALPLPTHPPQPPSIHARGLVNSGNTCYVNAVMQVLVRCTSFRSMLMRNGVDGVRLNSFEYPLVNFLYAVLYCCCCCWY